jgi:hypothetical protein
MIYVVGDSRKKFRDLDQIRTKFIVDATHDGENIDIVNQYFCELTGLYYMWRHDKGDIVGLEHYRRYMSIDGKTPIKEHEIRKRLKNHDILCYHVNYENRPIKSYFEKRDFYDWMQRYIMFMEVLFGKAYADHCRRYMNGNRHVLGNIFIAKRELLDEYAKYLFTSLFAFMDAERWRGVEIRSRVMGYLSEFLFGAWLTWTKKKECEIKVIFDEGKK